MSTFEKQLTLKFPKIDKMAPILRFSVFPGDKKSSDHSRSHFCNLPRVDSGINFLETPGTGSHRYALYSYQEFLSTGESLNLTGVPRS
jgi:hypothetical protein